jgi:hypothetical protein
MATLGLRVGSVVAISIVAAAVGHASGDPVTFASPPTLVLNVKLTATDGLPPSSRVVLITEAESIWKHGHVRLKWLGDASEADGSEVLRVLVVSRPVVTAEHAPWTVAELLRSEGSNAVAIASTTGARRIIDESRWAQLTAAPALYEHRLGIVLGRAVAHEIGHYLLRTSTHAKHGLMRARIDAREFADLRSGSFRLDDAAEAHLAMLAAKGAQTIEAVPGFSYSR